MPSHANNKLIRMDLNLLVAFDILMTERNVTRAGKVAGITQAAMSNTLRRLRQVFNDPLFIKTGSCMEPTALAIKLAGPIARALERIEGIFLRESFHPETSDRLFSVAISDCVTAIVVPALLDHLRKFAPTLRLKITDPGGFDHDKLLQRGETDLVISWFQWVTPGELRLQRFLEMQCIALSRPDNPLVAGKLTIERFLAARHLQYYPQGMNSTPVDEALEQMGKKRHIVGLLDSFGLIGPLVAGSDMLAVLPDLQAKFVAKNMNLITHPLPFRTATLRLAMAWHPRTDNSLAHVWLRDQISRIVGPLGVTTPEESQTSRA